MICSARASSGEPTKEVLFTNIAPPTSLIYKYQLLPGDSTFKVNLRPRTTRMKLLQGLSPWLALSAVILILTSSVKARVALSVSSIEDAEVLFDHQADANVTELKLRKREYTWEQALTEGKRLKKLMTGARTQSQWSSARQLEV